jgi:hypothetical protein
MQSSPAIHEENNCNTFKTLSKRRNLNNIHKRIPDGIVEIRKHDFQKFTGPVVLNNTGYNPDDLGGFFHVEI